MTVAAALPATLPPTNGRPALPVLRDRIAGIARGAEAPFVAAGSMLMTVVEGLDGIVAELEAVSGAIDRPAASASIADMQRVADHLIALPQAHAVRMARMDDITDAAKAGAANVLAAGRMLSILGIFGMNIGVASEGDPEFTGFAHHMSTRLTQGEHDLDGMTARLRKLTLGVTGLRHADRQLASEGAQVIPHVPRRLIRDATALGDHLAAAAAAADQVAATARRVRDQVAVILGAMQAGDRTRQRLEHIAAGLAMAETLHDDGAPPPAVAHFERLLSAQAEAAADDFDEDARRLADAFAALQPDAQQLLQLMQDRTGTVGAGSIAELENGIGEVMRLIERLCAADGQARAMHRLITDAIADLNRRLDSVRRLRGNVQVIATNIALLCRRHGQSGRAVSAIADQIDVQTAALSQATENIARPIGALLTVSEAMERDSAAPIDAAAILAGAMTVLGDGVRRSEAAAQHRRGGDEQQLIDTIGGAAGRIAQERTLAADIRGCAALLSARSPDITEPADADLAALTPALHSLGALYTMAQEREIHARFLPPGVQTETPVEAAGDEDDDGLF